MIIVFFNLKQIKLPWITLDFFLIEYLDNKKIIFWHFIGIFSLKTIYHLIAIATRVSDREQKLNDGLRVFDCLNKKKKLGHCYQKLNYY